MNIATFENLIKLGKFKKNDYSDDYLCMDDLSITMQPFDIELSFDNDLDLELSICELRYFYNKTYVTKRNILILNDELYLPMPTVNKTSKGETYTINKAEFIGLNQTLDGENKTVYVEFINTYKDSDKMLIL